MSHGRLTAQIRVEVDDAESHPRILGETLLRGGEEERGDIGEVVVDRQPGQPRDDVVGHAADARAQLQDANG